VIRTSFIVGTANKISFSETWPVPEDFNEEEESLYRELCVGNQLTVPEAQACVRALRG
jgi:hypothetical protein